MDKVSLTLQVFFEDPFWIGIFERREEGKLSACKVTFGAEPKEQELREFVLIYSGRLQFSSAVTADVKEAKYNPKKMLHKVHKEQHSCGIGTKSQQALKLQHEQQKIERKSKKHIRLEEEKQRLFELKQQKKKEKQRGR